MVSLGIDEGTWKQPFDTYLDKQQEVQGSKSHTPEEAGCVR